MELDEMKRIWLVLEEKLDKELSFKSEQMHEMIQSKFDQSLCKLTNSEISGGIVGLLTIPFLIWALETRVGNDIFLKISVMYMIMFCVVGCIWQTMKVIKLININHVKSLCSNMRNVERYKIWIKKEKLYGVLAALVGIFLFFPCLLNAPLWFWVAYIAIAIAGITFGLWQYKKICEPLIKSISEGLEKLKDLDC